MECESRALLIHELCDASASRYIHGSVHDCRTMFPGAVNGGVQIGGLVRILCCSLELPADAEGQRNDFCGSVFREHVVVTSFCEEFRVRAKSDTSANVVAALVWAQVSRD